jgi:hypothetical protein
LWSDLYSAETPAISALNRPKKKVLVRNRESKGFSGGIEKLLYMFVLMHAVLSETGKRLYRVPGN